MAAESSVDLPARLYSEDALRIAAEVFSTRLRVGWELEGGRHRLSLSALKAVDAAELESLAGEFVNELLNQEYRFIVGRFNRKIVQWTVTQALLSARGPEDASPKPVDAGLAAELAAMRAEAEDEIRRTMPKKIPPQGALYGKEEG